MSILALDIALLALSGAVGIYCATARITLIVWLFQYEEKIESRDRVKEQIKRLTYFVFATFAAGASAILLIAWRTAANMTSIRPEIFLLGMWVLLIGLFITFHIAIEKEEEKKRNEKEELKKSEAEAKAARLPIDSASDGRAEELQAVQQIGECLPNEKAGYDVMEADNGEIAIEAMNTGENRLTVDAMICDIRMPKINGLETIDYLRRAYPHVPVVVLTGFPDTQMAVECMRARRGGLPGETGGQQGVESGGRESDGTAGTGLAVSRLMRQRRTFHYSSVAAA